MVCNSLVGFKNNKSSNLFNLNKVLYLHHCASVRGLEIQKQIYSPVYI